MSAEKFPEELWGVHIGTASGACQVSIGQALLLIRECDFAGDDALFGDEPVYSKAVRDFTSAYQAAAMFG